MKALAKLLELSGAKDVPLVFLICTVVVEKNDPAQAEATGKILQPARDERVAKTQDEQFADREIHERKMVMVSGLSKQSLDAIHLDVALIS
ncbi:hypothetical protein [Methylocystis sp. H4A]|uniref:hypothetical protein n=1 Tax=Methylocystis sp. H4A TaxID=2785788 RepID=UPI0032B13459